MHLQALCSKADGSKGLAHIYIMPHVQKHSPVAAALQEGRASTAWQIPAIMTQRLLSAQVLAAALEHDISRTVTQVSRCNLQHYRTGPSSRHDASISQKRPGMMTAFTRVLPP